MKREIKKYKIRKIHPKFFWIRCNICNNEFKKKDMWKIEYRNHNVNICKECSPTYKDIIMYAENNTIVQLPLRSSKDVPPASTQRIPPPPKQPKL